MPRRNPSSQVSYQMFLLSLGPPQVFTNVFVELAWDDLANCMDYGEQTIKRRIYHCHPEESRTSPEDLTNCCILFSLVNFFPLGFLTKVFNKATGVTQYSKCHALFSPTFFSTGFWEKFLMAHAHNSNSSRGSVMKPILLCTRIKI